MDPGPSDRVPPRALRVADGDRQRVVEDLTEHFAVGRLTMAEVEQRMALAVAARTDLELAAVVDDLPALARPDAGRRPDLRALPTQVALFVTANLTLLLIWLATREPDPGPTDAGAGSVWPLWVTLVWGLALAAYALRDRGPGEAPART